MCSKGTSRLVESTAIAPPDLLPRLMERLQSHDGGELTSCPDTDIPAAIERVLADSSPIASRWSGCLRRPRAARRCCRA